MSYSVNLPVNAQGVVTLSVSFFDADQDPITVSGVSIVQKNSVDYATPQTFSWLTYTTSGTYLVPGGYKGSTSRLDTFIYIDTDHPDIETGSQYLIRVDYKDPVYPTKSVYLNFYNGRLEFEDLLVFYYGIPFYRIPLDNYFLYNTVSYNSSIPGSLPTSSLGGIGNSFRFFRSYFNNNVAGIYPLALLTSSYFNNPLGAGNDFHVYVLFMRTASVNQTVGVYSISFRLRTGFNNLVYCRVLGIYTNSFVFEHSSDYFSLPTTLITLSDYWAENACTLYEVHYSLDGTYSFLINGIEVLNHIGVTFSSVDTVRVEVSTNVMYGDIYIYAGTLFPEEKRMIRNKFTHKFYPFFKTPPKFTISVGTTQIYP